MANPLLDVVAQLDICQKRHGSSYRRRRSRQQIARNYKALEKASSLLRTLKQQKQRDVQPAGANNG